MPSESTRARKQICNFGAVYYSISVTYLSSRRGRPLGGLRPISPRAPSNFWQVPGKKHEASRDPAGAAVSSSRASIAALSAIAVAETLSRGVGKEAAKWARDLQRSRQHHGTWSLITPVTVSQGHKPRCFLELGSKIVEIYHCHSYSALHLKTPGPQVPASVRADRKLSASSSCRAHNGSANALSTS